MIDAKIGADGNFTPTDAVRTRAEAIIIAFRVFDQTADRVARRPLVRAFKSCKSAVARMRHWLQSRRR